MRILRQCARTAVPLAAAGLLVACAKAPVVAPVTAPPPAITIVAPPDAKPEVKAVMTFTVSPEANPDRTGRPSPVQVRVYQLRADAAFKNASLADLLEKEDSGLGVEMISRDQYLLTPKENRTIEVVLSGETRFVGAIAAYRDPDAQWRAIVPTPRKGLTIAVERDRLALSPVP